MTVFRRLAGGFAATAAAIALTAAPAPAIADDDDDDRDAGGTTTVVLNQSLVPALLGLGVAPIKPGTLTTPGGVAQVAFPITEIDDGVIEHSGGLKFSKAAAGTVKIKNFEVDPAAGLLTARTKVNDQKIGRIPVFTLGAVMPVSGTTIPTCSGVAAGLYLTQAAGAALGVPAGTFIGDACVVPVMADDDDDADDADDDRDDDD